MEHVGEIDGVCECCERRTGRDDIVPTVTYSDPETGEEYILCIPCDKKWRKQDLDAAVEELERYADYEDE
jgi:hypothetical protein